MDFGSLPLSLVHRVDLACDDFEAAWRAGHRPRIENALGEAAGPEQSVLLRALLALELELRRKLGEQPSSEEYLGRFPEYPELVRSVFDAASATTSLRPSALNATDEPVLADYEILGELGRGGMGVVYRARDRRRNQVVALKTVQRAAPAALLRFKQEFRTLADVSHPNLVALYELVSDGRSWFFTMEYIDGLEILRYINIDYQMVSIDPGSSGSRSSKADTWDPEAPPVLTQPCLRSAQAEIPSGDPALEPGLSPSRLGRLRASFRQLAEGVVALHDAGKLHRDIKPSNVLVTRRGRVVLLDFGLAADLEPSGLHQSSEPHLLGTIAYMAPEQAAGLPVSQASDWYSVGVMLYEAITGRAPFLGRPLEVLMDKQRSEPPAPHQLVHDVPEDLDALCVDLLHRDPAVRPSGRDVFFRLAGMTTGPEAFTSPLSSLPPAVSLIGRQRHLETLTAAFAAVEQGQTVVLYVHGCSGVGKSALVQRFLDDLVRRDEAVVLAGRCYEQEAVPYKAVDGLIDALARYLRRLPHAELRGLLPRDVGSLARVFPVLRHAEGVAAAPRRIAKVPDPREERRRAFVALRELVARLGDRRPLVLFIDDLQWGDADSAALLSELLRPPDPPVLLLLGCYRSEDAAASPLLRELLGPREEADSAPDQRELAIEALTGDEAESLAATLLGRGTPAARSQAEAIARESGGNPFFIAELVRYIQAGFGPADRPSARGEVALDDVLWTRVLRLPEDTRRFLEVVAVSGRPIGRAEAFRAAGLGDDERAALAMLRSGRLVRATGSAERDGVETYHDRVREVVVAHLTPTTLRGHHLRLALALEVSDQVDPEALAAHFQGAGMPEQAGRYFATAAAQAAETLAFDRAAKLYRLALESRPTADVGGRQLRAKLGDALANSGRGAEAAREYLAAATGADVAESLELRRRAAMQFLISGHVDEGLVTLRAVLDAVGMQLPGTPRGALWSLLFRRMQVRLRGLGFRPRDPSQVSAEDLTRIDICWSAAAGLSIIAPIRGADFQARGLLLALRAGEPYRIARALAIEAAHVACAGVPSRRRTATLLQAADTLAQRVAHPDALGTVCLVKGIVAYLEGRWKDSRESCDRAEGIFRDRCTGVTWELDTLHTFSLWSLTYLGDLAELGRRWPVLLKEARERGDRYAETNLSTFTMTVVRLAANDPEGARRELEQAMERWSRDTGQGFHIQHHNALLARVYIDLYNGEGRAAWCRVSEMWPTYVKSFLLRVQVIRIEMLRLHARVALAAAAASADPGPLLREAERDVRRLEHEGTPAAVLHARVIRAEVAATRRDKTGAHALLAAAVTGYEAQDMHLCAASARRRLGELLGGEEGLDLITQADRWMMSQTIRDPARMATLNATRGPARGFPVVPC